MDKNNIANIIKKIILDINDEAFFDNNTDLVDEQVLDSLETVTYLTTLEEEFDISISTDIYMEKNLGVINNMIDFIYTNY
jgi:acyl carrier protein